MYAQDGNLQSHELSITKSIAWCELHWKDIELFIIKDWKQELLCKIGIRKSQDFIWAKNI